LSRVNTLRQQGIAMTDAQKTFLPKTSEELSRFF